MTKLNARQRRYLKQHSHHLKPILQLGKEGVTPAFIEQLGQQLEVHELLKLRILRNFMGNESELDAGIEELGAHRVQKIGHIVTVFRAHSEESQYKLPT